MSIHVSCNQFYWVSMTVSYPTQKDAGVDHCPKPADQSILHQLSSCGISSWIYAGQRAFLKKNLMKSLLKHVPSHLG